MIGDGEVQRQGEEEGRQAPEEVGERGRGGSWWNAVMVGLVLVGLCAAVLSIAKPELAKPETWQAVVYGPAVEAEVVARDIGPAPVLRRGPTYKAKGHKVMSWIATGAGDATYNGTYVESGTYSGQPAYVNASGRWLFNNIANWWLGPSKSMTPILSGACYAGAGANPLPNNAWSTTVNGAAPAPTLAALTPGYPPVDPWTSPYDYSWWFDPGADMVPPAIPTAPCKVALGGSDLTDYVALAYQSMFLGHGVLLAELDANGVPTDDWFDLPTAADLFDLGVNPYNSGVCIDDGDGTHLWISSGAAVNGSDALVTVWKKFALDVSGLSATEVSAINVGIPSAQLSNAVPMGDGTVRFMVLDGTTWKFCEYVPGDAGYTVIGNFPEVPGFPEGYSAFLMPALETDDIEDQVLFLNENGTLYWMRHCAQAGAGAHHLVMACEVTTEGVVNESDALLPVEPATLAYMTQTYGYYTDFDQIVGDVGLDSYRDTAIRWAPGEAAVSAKPFVDWPVKRRWYVGGDPLLVAGWAEEAFENRPFVMVARGATITLGLAVATPVAFPLGTTGELEPASFAPEGMLQFSGSMDLRADAARLSAEGTLSFSGEMRLKTKSALYPQGTLTFYGSMALQSGAEQIVADGPGLYGEMKLTPGVFPGVARRLAVPTGYGRRTNRLYGGPLPVVGYRPAWHTPVDAGNPLAQYVKFWSWMSDISGNVATDASTEGNDAALAYVFDNYSCIVSDVPEPGYNQIYSPVTDGVNDWWVGYDSADGLKRMRQIGGSLNWSLMDIGGTIIRTSTYDHTGWWPWEQDWISATVAAGTLFSKWGSQGLQAYGDYYIPPSHVPSTPSSRQLAALTLAPVVSAFTWVFDVTPWRAWGSWAIMALRNGSNYIWMDRYQNVGGGSDGKVRLYLKPAASAAQEIFFAAGEYDFGDRQRIILAMTLGGDVSVYINGTQFGPVDISGYVMPDLSSGVVGNFLGLPVSPWSPAQGIVHEVGYLAGYAATAEDVAQNPALSRAYGFANVLM